MAKDTNIIQKLTSDDIDKIIGIVNSTVRSRIVRTGNQNISQDQKEDWQQEAVLAVLEAIKEAGKMLNDKQIRTVADRQCVDIIRREVKRNHASLDYAGESGEDHQDYSGSTYAGSDRSTVQDTEDEVLANYQIDDLLNDFPDGSPEQTYIKFKLEKGNIKDFGFNPPKTRQEDGYTDGYLASLLGFKGGSGSRPWKRLKYKMDKYLEDKFAEMLDSDGE